MNVLTTIKSLTELDIDLIDSNEAMLVLNNLPNVQILNGRSTKDDDDEEEDNAGEGEYEENAEMNPALHNENINNIYNNELNNRNNHLYPQMEEIQEDKNLENNSNYVSEKNNLNSTSEQNNESNQKNINNSNETINENDKTSGNISKEKDKKMTRNPNALGENENNQKKESEDKNSKKESTNDKLDINLNIDLISKKDQQILNSKNSNAHKIKEKESFYEMDSNKTNKNTIDLTPEELDSLKGEKYNEKSEFISLMKEFYELMGNEEEISEEGAKLQNNYLNKLKMIEEKKTEIPNYYYFFLLYKKKIKMIQNMYKTLFPYILNKCPELNKDQIIPRLNNELYNTIKDSKELMNLLYAHIDGFIDKKTIPNNNNNNLNELIKEKDKKITSLEKIRDKLLLDIEKDKGTNEKKISNLEKENKIMTEKIFTKLDTIVNPTILDTQTTIPISERYTTKQYNKKNHSQNKKQICHSEILNTNFVNHYCPTSKTRSPYKSTENTNTLEYNNTINNNYINTNSTINTNRQQLISLKTLKDFINELYASKAAYDLKCTEMKLPKETLEEHMYTFLNKKYGLKNLIIEWAKNVISGIKYYSKKDSIVLLFGKIMRNEQEEDARFIIQKVSESIEELLLYYIKRQNPLKLVTEIKKIFEKKKKSELFEEEWKGIIYSIYENEEATEIEKKIENFIAKENEKKKMEMFKKYKNSRLNSKHKKNKYINNYTGSNSYYLNTVNSSNNAANNNLTSTSNSFYMNTLQNANVTINANTKLSRVEKYNMLLFSEEKKILFNHFIKIVLDNHIRFRDKQLKKFVDLFKIVDKNKDGIIDEDEFSDLVHKMKIVKEEEVENTIFQYLDKIDPFDNQKFTFSECVTFFSGEIIKDTDVNGNEKEISVLEKVCFTDIKNENQPIETNNNDANEIEPIIESTITTDNNGTINNNALAPNRDEK